MKRHGEGTRWVCLAHVVSKPLTDITDQNVVWRQQMSVCAMGRRGGCRPRRCHLYVWHSACSEAITQSDGQADECVVDPIVSATLERTKQWWILINANQSKLADMADGLADRSGSKADRGCQKDIAWLRQHPEYLQDHPDCKDMIGKSRQEHRRSRSQRYGAIRRVKNTGDEGPFHLVPVDHLLDMQTRALSGTEKRTAGGSRSTRLDEFDPEDLQQQWYLQRTT